MTNILRKMWLKDTPFFVQPVTLFCSLIVISAHFLVPEFLYRDDRTSALFFGGMVVIVLLLFLAYNLFAESKYK